jgi:hypothetical protein
LRWPQRPGFGGTGRLAQREATEEAQAARLADLNRRADALKARERAAEDAQMAVLQSFRREHGL